MYNQVLDLLADWSARNAENLAKGGALDSTALGNAKIYSQDPEIYSTLFRAEDADFAKLVKLMPYSMIKQRTHNYTQILSHGSRKVTGFFSEGALPPRNRPEFANRTRTAKLCGLVTGTGLLATQEQTVTGDPAIVLEQNSTRLNLVALFAKNLYFADTSKVRSGDGGTAFKGLLQQIREGTDGTEWADPTYGSHVIDMKGAALTVDTLREYSAITRQIFGSNSIALMNPLVRTDFEKSLDGAYRINLPIGGSAFTVGQNFRGIRNNNGLCLFESDNTLAIERYYEDTDPADGIPASGPTISSASAAGAAGDTNWDADSAGDHFYVITEVVNGVESPGTRYPASVSAYVTVADGDDVTISVTPSNPRAEQLRIYRGSSVDGGAKTDAYYIDSVAVNGAGAISYVDHNDNRPNTSTVFMLDMQGDAVSTLINAPEGQAYSLLAKNYAEFISKGDQQSGIHWGRLGPSVFQRHELAAVTSIAGNELWYTAGVPLVRRPRFNWVFKNVGRAA